MPSIFLSEQCRRTALGFNRIIMTINLDPLMAANKSPLPTCRLSSASLLRETDAPISSPPVSASVLSATFPLTAAFLSPPHNPRH